MFTGLVETTGVIVQRNVSGGDGVFSVRPDNAFSDLKYGESIAINGTCLTMEKVQSDGAIVFHVLGETLKRTNLGALPIGGKVNMERALAVGDRLGGHIVSGHVDVTSPVRAIRRVGDDYEYEVALPESLKPCMVEKGSVTIDGISLTVVEVTDEYFTVHLIPVTLSETALVDRKPGSIVNLEGDIIGKFVARQMSLANYGGSNLSFDSLVKAGW